MLRTSQAPSALVVVWLLSVANAADFSYFMVQIVRSFVRSCDSRAPSSILFIDAVKPDYSHTRL